MPEEDEGGEEASKEEEEVDGVDAGEEDEDEGPGDDLIEVDGIECSCQKVFIGMPNDNPHHRYCSHPIPHIQVLPLPYLEEFHIATYIEAFQPFVLVILTNNFTTFIVSHC